MGRRVKRSRYQVTRVYQVSCKTCNEFTYDSNDDPPKTPEEVEQAIRDHEEDFHPDG